MKTETKLEVHITLDLELIAHTAWHAKSDARELAGKIQDLAESLTREPVSVTVATCEA